MKDVMLEYMSILRNRYYAVENLIPARAQKTRDVCCPLTGRLVWTPHIISIRIAM